MPANPSGNPLLRLNALGQSVWYDYIRRDLLSGELARLIAEDGLKGMTSNPSIFEKAIAASELYDDDVRRAAAAGKGPEEIFESLAVADVRQAADVFRPVYEATGGNDGFVSIEVGPRLALDTRGSIDEARRLWKACDRPNVMVKIPGTEAGVPAIRQCLTEGININITLLFSVPRHRQVMEAYLQAMESRVAAGQPVGKIRSVASFFVSRVDTNVDKKLDAIAKAGDGAGGRSAADRQKAKDLRGRVGIANARLAYQAFREVFESPRFAKLKAKGVAVQRPLWASTSTKDPAYPDLYYIEALIGPETVDTIPPETFAAYRDHGDPQVRIEDDLDGARAAFAGIAELGIDEAAVSQELEDEGVKKFTDSFDQLLKAVEGKEAAIRVS